MSNSKKKASAPLSVKDKSPEEAAAIRKLGKKPNTQSKYRVINSALARPMGSLFGQRYTENNRKRTPGRNFDMVPVKEVMETGTAIAVPREQLLRKTGGFQKVFKATE